MDIGKRLQDIRQKKHISVYRLSQDTGISTSHINSIERNEKHPSVETLCRLVKPLGITMSEFFNEESNVTYLNDAEKEIVEYFRTMSNDSADALLLLVRSLKKSEQ